MGLHSCDQTIACQFVKQRNELSRCVPIVQTSLSSDYLPINEVGSPRKSNYRMQRTALTQPRLLILKSTFEDAWGVCFSGCKGGECSTN
ncbi:hypothetical protein O9929_20305 [Vibrio lentus]|nr:hypothetical protein [Vibrio lentus]